MGYVSAVSMIEAAGEDPALRWHLEANHFPPLDPVLIPSAKQALDAAEADEWNAVIELPNGKVLRAADVIEGLHLQAFLEARVLGS